MASGKEKNEIEEIYEKYYKDVYRFVLALSKNCLLYTSDVADD